jgi:glycosyltransferase involved in cell wall biosynthesis
MIKSAHLTESVSRKAGGLFEAILRLVQAHDAKNMDVKVFGLHDEFTDMDAKAWSPVPVAAFPAGWPGAIGRSPEFMRALLEFQPDIVHTHGLWRYPSIAARNYSRTWKRPYLISPHGMLDPWALRNSRWKKCIAAALFENEHLRGARCLRALCESEANSIRQLGFKDDIAIVPNGIDLPAAIRTMPPPWQGVIEPGKKILLFLSRIHPKKGLVNLLKAWATIQNSKSENPNIEKWVLAIAGWDQGGHEAELKKLCTEMGILFKDVQANVSGTQHAASLIFIGAQFNEAKIACYQHCDAFVLPSFSEGLPMVVLEAWANAKPVLMTPECNLSEGFRAGAALKVEATSASLVAGLNELFRMTDADRSAMGGRARRLVEERFTWVRVGQQMREIYQWILGGGNKPDSLVDA